MTLYLMAIGIWLILMVLAIVNATLRETLLNRLFGPPIGHVISTFILTAVILVIAYYFVRANVYGHASGQFIVVGVIWLLLTLAFEFLFGHYVMGNSWEKLLADYNVAKGKIWILIPLAMLISPILYFITLRRS